MKRFLLVAVLALLAPVGFAQETVEHRVKWYETITTIGQKYGIDPQVILNFNNLKEEDIKSRVILQIPLNPIAEADTLLTEVPTADIKEDEQEETNIIFSFDNPLKVSLVLPFGAADEKSSVNYFDFYSGALLSLKKAKEDGHPVQLNVYDSRTGFEEILQNPEFAASNLIIGPVRSADIAPYAQFSLEHSIPSVSPMDQAAEVAVDSNRFFFQVPSSSHQHLLNLVNSIETGPDDVVLVIFDSSMKEEEYLNRITEALDSSSVNYRKIGYGILSGRDFSEKLQKELDHEKNYKVIVASEDDAFAPDIVRNMRVLTLFGLSVELYCSNRVRNFDSIDSDSFYELSAHVCAPYYIDYSEAAVKDFILQYRALFNAEPTPYSYQGFDIFTYFITNFCEHGSSFVVSASEHPCSLLQTNISFDRNCKKSGWRNTATRNLVFNPDFTISIEQPDQD